MAIEPATSLRKKRRRVQQKRRTDAGSVQFRVRDSDIIRFAAEQTFARADSLGEYLAPGHTPAVAEPPASQLADTTAPTKRAWPADSRHRQMAVSKLLRKLSDRGYLEVIQPWDDQPPWFRATAFGLRYLSLDWPEIPFPDNYKDLEDRLRHDDQFISHNHLINQVRLLLARRGAGAPPHTWKGERAIELALPPRQRDVRRPHKADGILSLKEAGTWSITAKDGTILETVEMQPGQLLGIEVECHQKSDHRLSEILPDLVAHHDYVWYFCLTPTIKQAVADARKQFLATHEQRRRLRVLLLEDYLPCR